MDNPANAGHKNGYRILHTKRASLDRVDPARGYAIDNCEWVCYIVNWMKNSFSRTEVIDTAKAITEHDSNRKI